MCIKTLTHLDYHSCHFYNIKMYRANNIKKYRYGIQNLGLPKGMPGSLWNKLQYNVSLDQW